MKIQFDIDRTGDLQEGITCFAWILATETGDALPEAAKVGFVAKTCDDVYIVNLQILGIRVTYKRRHAIKPFIAKTMKEHGFQVAA